MKNKKRIQSAPSPLGLIFLPALGFLALSCSDENLDDFNRQNQAQQFSQIQAATGDYQGMLYSKADRSQIGWMEVNLSALEKITPSTDGSSKANEQPILVGEVTLQGEQPGALTFTDSYYDPDTQNFSAIISISAPLTMGTTGSSGGSAALSAGASAPATVPAAPGAGPAASMGQALEIALSGQISGGTFRGQIAAVPYTSEGAAFTLVRNATPPASRANAVTASRSGILAEQQVVLQAYSGTTDFVKDKESHAVNLIVLAPNNVAEQSFYNLLSPVKTVEVTLNYGENLQIDYPGSTLDARTGEITGQTTLMDNGQTETLSLKCDATTGAGSGFVCAHVTNATAQVATSILQQASINVQNPPDTAAETRSYIDSFLGTVKFQGGATRQALLNVLHPREDRQTELLDLFFPYARDTVDVSLNFGDNTEQEIQQAQLDTNAGTLTGTYMINNVSQAQPGTGSAMFAGAALGGAISGGGVVGGLQSAAVTLDCRSATGGGGAAEWVCDFFNSEGGAAANDCVFTETKNPPAQLNPNLSTLRTRMLIFHGKTNWPDPTRAGADQSATLTVTYPALTRQQDLSYLFFPPEQVTVQSSLSFYDAGIKGPWTTLNFTQATWDLANNELDGNQSMMDGSTTFAATLRCKNFKVGSDFEVEGGATAQINCDYLNPAMGNQVITIPVKLAPASGPAKKTGRR